MRNDSSSNKKHKIGQVIISKLLLVPRSHDGAHQGNSSNLNIEKRQNDKILSMKHKMFRICRLLIPLQERATENLLLLGACILHSR